MWSTYRRCEISTRLDGKVAIITGANCGIGKYTALDFVRRGEKRIVLEWLIVLFHIWEVPVTNLDSESGSSAKAFPDSLQSLQKYAGILY
jgi:hypothetical protein